MALPSWMTPYNAEQMAAANQGMTPEMANQTINSLQNPQGSAPPNQYAYNPMYGPPTGLIGSEQALMQGMMGGIGGLLSGIGQGRADLLGQTGMGVSALRNATNAGNRYFNMGAGIRA